ncbi:MAG: capsule biosynthesis protein, partial [Sphingomonadaceae bacterium]
MKQKPIQRRAYLFLQGPPGPFFHRLGATLSDHGFPVYRINFNGGDRSDWSKGAVGYSGQAQDWPHYFDRFVVRHGITDLILFGDCRPLHAAAHGMATMRKLRIHVFEEGYIRPDWVTMELDGVNGHSTLSKDPNWYLERAKKLSPLPELPSIPAREGRRWREAAGYYAKSLIHSWRFPHYASHRPEPWIAEAAGWGLRLLKEKRELRRTGEMLAAVEDLPHFLLPLQLSSDHQIRVHSPFANMKVAADYVIDSFARAAPDGLHLVVKQHPLDNGLVNWRRYLRRRARRHGVAGRVHFVEGGNIDTMVRQARGLVTVNSTTGTLALSAGVPVKVLGRAIYDIDGITDQGLLDDFWSHQDAPDPEIYDAFCRTLLDRCLIRGGFASEEGLRLLIDAAFRRLTAD